MTDYDKRNVRELFGSLCKSYELLCEYNNKYVEYNQGESTKSELKGVMLDLMRSFPSCSLHIEHDCCYHDYDEDNRCAICGNVIDEDLEDWKKEQAAGV